MTNNFMDSACECAEISTVSVSGPLHMKALPYLTLCSSDGQTDRRLTTAIPRYTYIAR